MTEQAPFSCGNGVAPFLPTHRHKQLARIVQHLRDDLSVSHPLIPMPTQDMITHLVTHCPLALLQQADWIATVTAAMTFLTQQLDPVSGQPQWFKIPASGQPLFPNTELFEPYDAYLFCQTLLGQLQLMES